MTIRLFGLRAAARRERRARRWDKNADEQASLASHYAGTLAMLGAFLSEETVQTLTEYRDKHRTAERIAREMARRVRAGER